ncbi:taurine catabolism dioxygenase [Fragilaria crotonensis]|nr:taurine catabolism dioxygenase [Fragilaria crotonensis]
MPSSSSTPSPMKLRRKATTPLRERVVGMDAEEINDFRENHSDRYFPTRRRRLRKSRYVCMMLWGATAFFGATALLILASRETTTESILPKVLRLRPRRRLGITVVQPIPIHNSQGPIKTIVISDSTRDELYQEVANLKVDTSNIRDLESFIDQAKETIHSHIGDDFLKALRSLHNSSSPTSAIWIRNLPVDPFVPPNPTDGTAVSLGKHTYVAEAMLVGLGELTNSHVVGYSAETQYSNPWIHEGFPRNTHSGGSALTKASDLAFHQDMSYHPEAPDILGLVSIREGHDHQVQTELIDNREILETLPHSIVDMLREPRFEIKTSDWVDASYHDLQKNDEKKVGTPILTGAASLAIPVEWENMVGLDREADWAIQMLQRAILEAPKHYVHFVPGDLLLFNNKRTLHARTPYVDLRFDGGDRVLSRAYFRKEVSDKQRITRMI